MISAKSYLWTTLLDLICCAMGAAIVLLMISASTISIDAPRAGANSLVVRSIPVNGSQPAEVGIEYRSPNSDVWKSEADSPSLRYSAASDSSLGGQAFLILMNPEPGTWLFRPYLRDFPIDTSKPPDEFSLIPSANTLLEMDGRAFGLTGTPGYRATKRSL